MHVDGVSVTTPTIMFVEALDQVLALLKRFVTRCHSITSTCYWVSSRCHMAHLIYGLRNVSIHYLPYASCRKLDLSQVDSPAIVSLSHTLSHDGLSHPLSYISKHPPWMLDFLISPAYRLPYRLLRWAAAASNTGVSTGRKDPAIFFGLCLAKLVSRSKFAASNSPVNRENMLPRTLIDIPKTRYSFKMLFRLQVNFSSSFRTHECRRAFSFAYALRSPLHTRSFQFHYYADSVMRFARSWSNMDGFKYLRLLRGNERKFSYKLFWSWQSTKLAIL